MRRVLSTVATTSSANNVSKYTLGKEMKQCFHAAHIEALILSPQNHKHFDAYHCTNAFRLLGMKKSTNKAAITTLLQVSSQLDSYPLRDVSMTIHALAKYRLVSHVPSFFTPHILAQLSKGSISSQSLTMMLWAFAKLDNNTSNNDAAAVCIGLLDKIAASDLQEFSTQALVNTVWAMATLKTVNTTSKHDELCMRISTELQQRKHTLVAQDLANTLWAFASLGVCDDALFAYCAQCMEPLLSSFSLQHLSNTLWAFATMDFKKDDAVKAVVTEFQSRLDLSTASPQGLSNSMWALAKLESTKSSYTLMMDHLVSEVHRRQQKEEEWALLFSTQALANIMWALASVSSPSLLRAQLVKHIANEIVHQPKRVLAFSDQDFVHFMWAFGRMEFRHKQLAHALARFPHVDRLTPSSLVSVIWAFAILDVPDSELHRRLVFAALEKVSLFSLEELGTVLWACAHWNFTCREWIAALAHELQTRNVISPVLLWGFACLDQLEEVHVKTLLLTVPAIAQLNTKQDWQQMRQAHLAWEQVHPHLSVDVFSGGLFSREATGNKAEFFLDSSHTQQMVALKLRSIISGDVMVQEEALLLDGRVCVDVFVPSLHLVVEVDGPTHYLLDGRTLNGPTRFKHRLLKRGGFRVESISACEFTRESEKEQSIRLHRVLEG